MEYSKLNLKIDNSVKTFTFNEQKISVFQYLSIKDKYDLLMDVLEKSKTDDVYNDLKVDTLFHMYLIIFYSDINFTEEEKNNVEEVYDEIYSSGFLDCFLKAMNPKEYSFLYETLQSLMLNLQEYNSTLVSYLKSFSNDLPKQTAAAAKMVEEFDPEKYQNILNFVNAANGNRNFKTNKPIN